MLADELAQRQRRPPRAWRAAAPGARARASLAARAPTAATAARRAARRRPPRSGSSPDHTCYTIDAARARPHPAPRRRARARLPAPRRRPPTRCPSPRPVRCLSVVVPLDRSGDVPGAIRIRAARIRSRTPTRPPLIGLTGGPGPGRRRSSRRATTTSCRPPAATSSCSTSAARAPPGLLRCPSLERRIATPSRRAAAACGRSLGARRSFYTSADSADDIEALRIRLGVPRIALYAVSYGTRVAVEYARRYPERVERMILDSPVGIDAPDALARETLERGRRGSCATICRPAAAAPRRIPCADLARLVPRLRRAPIRLHRAPRRPARAGPRRRRRPARAARLQRPRPVVHAPHPAGRARGARRQRRAARAAEGQPLGRATGAADASASASSARPSTRPRRARSPRSPWDPAAQPRRRAAARRARRSTPRRSPAFAPFDRPAGAELRPAAAVRRVAGARARRGEPRRRCRRPCRRSCCRATSTCARRWRTRAGCAATLARQGRRRARHRPRRARRRPQRLRDARPSRRSSRAGRCRGAAATRRSAIERARAARRARCRAAPRADRRSAAAIAAATAAGASSVSAWPAPGTMVSVASRQLVREPARQRDELRVALARQHGDRHRQLAEALPQRRHRARADPAQRGGEMLAGGCAGGPRARPPRPPATGRRTAAARPSGRRTRRSCARSHPRRERLVARAPRGALAPDPRCPRSSRRARAASRARGARARRAARSARPSSSPRARSGPPRAPATSRHARGHVDRPPRARRAVPAQVGRQRPVAFALEVARHLVPAAPGLREAMQQEERLGHARHHARRPRHPSAAARVRRRARALRRARGVHVAGVAQLADRARARPRRPPALLLAHRRALRRASSPSAPRRRRAARSRSPCTSGTAAANLAPAVIEA